ncbi:hypothetical protein D0860_02801 [Hortaea werneckii]|uniref:Uncharacterized protein n=1 Tax=Hortaea werneckii TaxID=91943 RepID=A0A3M7HHH0_HORWE|nr:hypothetical protein D0860_02801 [Hortaea werneckii]
MVSQETPAREDANGMDDSRYAALHNAILQHDWLKPGRSQEEFELTVRPYLEDRTCIHTSLLSSELQERFRLTTRRTLSTTYEVSLLPSAGTEHIFLDPIRLPWFTYFAPGLRVATEQEIVDEPYTHHEEDSDAEDERSKVPPLLLLRADVLVNAVGLLWLRAFEPVIPQSVQCPCGPYLTNCDRTYRYPQESGCNLVLSGTASSCWARKADLGPVDSYDDLLQTIEQGRCAVDIEGVADGLKKWCEADTEERWRKYVTNVGPEGC